MLKVFGRIFPYLCIAGFIMHWILVFLFALPTQFKTSIISPYAPRIKTMFSSWKLFTPPYTSHARLYFIIKDTTSPGTTDTLEVLEQLALRKRARAPFNQKETVIDHLVNNSVSGLLRTTWEYKTIPGEPIAGLEDSSYISQAIVSVEKSRNYQLYIATLYNYCRIILKERKITVVDKEVKIMIQKKMIRPFKDINNDHYISKEILVFESPFKVLTP